MKPFVCQLCHSTRSVLLVDNIRDWEYGVEGEYSYRRCTSCQSVQLHPFPDLELLKKAYPDEYLAHVDGPESRGLIFSWLYKINQWAFARKLQNRLPDNAAVLDVGCGNGSLLLELRELGAVELNGVDFSEHACQLASNNGITAFAGLFLDYPRQSQTLDVIFMMNYLEHVEHPDKELKKTHELLTKDGWLIGECPNFDAIDRQIFSRFWGGNHVPRHTFQYGTARIREMLKTAGFSEIIIRQEMNPSVLLISIQNWFQRDCVDLANNPNLERGRMKGFPLGMLLLLPINVLFVLMGRSGIMRFYAKK
ncbi:MAG: methyltransferase domain-containing protein [Halioglobus sp.]|nr:methyltransferase domain-containing protein [Halioglobus sp.]